MPARRIVILNGPNLNMLGAREREHYGTVTLGEIEERCRARAAAHGFDTDFRQTNSEAELVGWIQQLGDVAGLVLNAAAYTHSSIAIHDALKTIACPCVEVHLSNTAGRERFRHRSFVAPAATGTISGFGSMSYELAVEAIAELASSGDGR